MDGFTSTPRSFQDAETADGASFPESVPVALTPSIAASEETLLLDTIIVGGQIASEKPSSILVSPQTSRTWNAIGSAITQPQFLIPLFATLTLANRVLLSIQYTYTSYPLFVNLYWNCVTIPINRALWIWKQRVDPSVIPSTPPPQWVFWAMALLNCLDNMLVSVALSKLEGYGALQVMLSQARIPVSMMITKLFFRGRKYIHSHYAGAGIVIMGILITLLPDLDGQAPAGAELLPGIGLYLLHCIPAAFLIVVQEKILAHYSVDEYYLLGANQHQGLIITLALLVPMAMLDGVPPSEVGANLANGASCQFGINPPGKSSCEGAPYATHAYILVNIVWNVVAIFVISTVGANVYTIVSTATVPVNALVFAIPGMPAYKPASGWTAGGFIVVLIGVVVFQFFTDLRDEAAAGFPRVRRAFHSLYSWCRRLCSTKAPETATPHASSDWGRYRFNDMPQEEAQMGDLYQSLGTVHNASASEQHSYVPR